MERKVKPPFQTFQPRPLFGKGVRNFKRNGNKLLERKLIKFEAFPELQRIGFLGIIQLGEGRNRKINKFPGK